NVSTTSATKHAASEYPPGECAPYPFDANPPLSENPSFPLAIKYSTALPATPPTTCATMYGKTSPNGNRFPIATPTAIAGSKWQPATAPIAQAIAPPLKPNASATPRTPTPNCGNPADNTAAPHPPNTSQNVPKNSAANFFDKGIVVSFHLRQDCLGG